MKLRVRLQSRTVVVSPENDATLGVLKNNVGEVFNLQEDSFFLTLNGRDPIEESDDKKLTELGLVSGDLIKVLLRQGVQPPDSVNTGVPGSSGHGRVEQPSSISTASCNHDPRPSHSNTSSEESSDGQNKRLKPSRSELTSAVPQGSDPVSPGQGACEEDMDMGGQLLDTGQREEHVVNRYLEEPIHCRDSTDSAVPHLLQSTYQSAQVTSKSDALWVVLHVLMVETGFQAVCHGSSQQDLDKMDEASTSSPELHTSQHMPEGWRSAGGGFKLTYSHHSCPELTCTLVGVTLGSTLAVHGLISEDVDTCDMTMNVTDYVRDMPCDACQAFRQLPKLSRLFKDNIAYVLLGRLRQALNLPTLHGLMGLLPELKVLIMSYLDAPSLCVMARVCKELKTLTREPSLWRRLYLKTFGSYRDNSLSHNWYPLYKQRYLERKAAREQVRMVLPGMPHRFGIPPLPFAPGVHPPGFRGGDYDLDPFGGSGPLFSLPRPRFDPLLGLGVLPRPRPGPGVRNPRPSYGGGGFGPRFF